ncbi:type I secretion system permease/ATPase [Ferrimonas kyonanensis]|uniref:type I secretion system permease/ATPase n=1 Tax=Ferrimonas kyonanensis TaxID=364763 RepID=UPI0004199B91|nr:type I secretion system permease/ATPase [Ferrimonas kyonanensis]
MSDGVFGRAQKRTLQGTGLACGFSLFISILLLAIPLYSLQLFERVATSGSVPTLIALFSITAFLLLLQAGLDLVRSQILRHSATQLDYHLSPALLLDAIDSSGQQLSPRRDGLNHLNRVCAFLCSPVATALLELPWTPLFLIILALFHPLLAGLVLAGVGLMLACSLVLGRWLSEREPEQGRGALNHYLNKSRVILAMGMGPSLSLRWRDENARRLLEHGTATSARQGVAVVFRFVRQLTQMTLLGVGIYLVLQDALSMGGVIAASMIGGRMLTPFEPLLQRRGELSRVRDSWQQLTRLGEALDHQSARLPLPRPRGDLLVNNVSFVAPQKKIPQLKQVGFRLHAGQSLAIMGPSASGKSTLISLLLGMIRPTAGEVRIDGASLNQWTPETLGQYIGYLPQDVELIEGTIAQNIGRFGESNDSLVLQAAQAAQVHELITALPQGYETRVGELGYPLSSGQKQRIALARALYGNPSILILDEPISNLDLEGEQVLAKILARCKTLSTTVVMVTHSPSLLNLTDWIVCLQNGAVVKAGLRDEVLGKMKVAQVPKQEEVS